MQLNNKVIMAAAGAGKTWGICKEVIEEAKKTNKKILITTYTNKGIESIEKEYRKQNSGVVDENIVILTWFQFLLSDLVKPYQRSILNEYNVIKSIDFNKQYGFINYAKRGTRSHYITKNNVKRCRGGRFKSAKIKMSYKCNKPLKLLREYIYIYRFFLLTELRILVK